MRSGCDQQQDQLCVINSINYDPARHNFFRNYHNELDEIRDIRAIFPVAHDLWFVLMWLDLVPLLLRHMVLELQSESAFYWAFLAHAQKSL